MAAAATQRASQAQNSTNKPSSKPPTKKLSHANNLKKTPTQDPSKPSLRPKSASIAGETPVTGATSAYSIVASRIASRMAEIAENLTFVERPKPRDPIIESSPEDLPFRRPRKLEMRLGGSGGSDESVAFSAPFLDNTLEKMLALQKRMLGSTAEVAKGLRKGGGEEGEKGKGEEMVRELAGQSAELSRIIALICAEKARVGG